MPAAPGINTAKKTSPTTEAGNTTMIVNSFNPLLSEVNYPFAKDKWASGFTALRFFAEVLFIAPPV